MEPVRPTLGLEEVLEDLAEQVQEQLPVLETLIRARERLLSQQTTLQELLDLRTVEEAQALSRAIRLLVLEEMVPLGMHASTIRQ